MVIPTWGHAIHYTHDDFRECKVDGLREICSHIMQKVDDNSKYMYLRKQTSRFGVVVWPGRVY